MSNSNIVQTDKWIIRWLQVGIVLVILMIAIGGITRLTQSGLSIVHWKPLHFLPPLNEQQWQEEFSAYQSSPEFLHYNHQYQLSDFKKIYFWEYLHRLVGRMIGLVFLIPFLFFYFKKMIRSRTLLLQLLLIFVWGGFQGFLGWYMVKSGLVDNPHVSHYRLTIHLLTAFTMAGYIHWVILGIKHPKTENKQTIWSKLPWLLIAITLVQITFGAFTAGLKAGYLYPTYPLMGGRLLPQEASESFRNNGLISLIEHPSLVQFVHRWLGFAVLVLVITLYLKFRKSSWNLQQKRTFQWVVGWILLQFTLGICTLVFHVPIVIAVVHQVVAFVLLLALIRLLYFFKKT